MGGSRLGGIARACWLVLGGCEGGPYRLSGSGVRRKKD